MLYHTLSKLKMFRCAMTGQFPSYPESPYPDSLFTLFLALQLSSMEMAVGILCSLIMQGDSSLLPCPALKAVLEQCFIIAFFKAAIAFSICFISYAECRHMHTSFNVLLLNSN
nr:hypothetical protein Itr_chr14CG02110 [Ipomoea trifida]GMD91670.1 hypothetical protein Iba_chr14eCG1630 [Ipomoea batatas]GME17004.1 hypothetical protein Iba_scaffold18226CG0030 [Ipomoea batatas]